MTGTGYYLIDHPNPHSPHYYTTRRGSVLACVLHITAGLQGRPTGADSSAEQTARYAATTDRAVSWHSGSDRDSHLRLLPDTYTAWQCEGYNSRTIGHEISKRDVGWADEDPAWVASTLEMAAASLRPRLKQLGIPLRRASRADLDRAIAVGAHGLPVGLIGHADLDPDRRRDPGEDFPWARFLDLLQPQPVPLDVQEDDMPVIVAIGKGHYVTDFMTKRPIRGGTAEERALLAAGVKKSDLDEDAVRLIPDAS